MLCDGHASMPPTRVAVRRCRRGFEMPSPPQRGSMAQKWVRRASLAECFPENLMTITVCHHPPPSPTRLAQRLFSRLHGRISRLDLSARLRGWAQWRERRLRAWWYHEWSVKLTVLANWHSEERNHDVSEGKHAGQITDQLQVHEEAALEVHSEILQLQSSSHGLQQSTV